MFALVSGNVKDFSALKCYQEIEFFANPSWPVGISVTMRDQISEI